MTSLSKPSSTKPTRTNGSTSTDVFHLERRFKITKLKHIDTKDTASLLNVALDANSEDTLDEFECPICREIPLEEIFQCAKGHTVCKACLGKQTTQICSQCRMAMKLDDHYIRSLPLENILNKMWIACPFKSKGCTEILVRRKMRQHTHFCNFNDDDVIHICQHLYSGKNCTFHINRKNITKTLEQFRYLHKTGNLRDIVENNAKVLSIYLNRLRKDTNYPKAISLGFGQNQQHFLVVLNINSNDECVRLLAINLNKSSAADRETEMVLKLKLIGNPVPFSLEVTPLKTASEMLDKKLFKLHLAKSVLEECNAVRDRMLHICNETFRTDPPISGRSLVCQHE